MTSNGWHDSIYPFPHASLTLHIKHCLPSSCTSSTLMSAKHLIFFVVVAEAGQTVDV